MRRDEYRVSGTQKSSQGQKLAKETDIIKNHQLVLKGRNQAARTLKPERVARAVTQVTMVPTELLDRCRLAAATHPLAEE